MSGINRFLSRRDKTRSGSRQKKVIPLLLSPPVPYCAPPFLDGQSCGHGIIESCSPKRRSNRSSSSSLESLSLAFPDSPPGKSSPPHLRPSKTPVHSSTANSLDCCILQPGPAPNNFYGLFTPDKKSSPDKDEKEKVRVAHAQEPDSLGSDIAQIKHLSRKLSKAGLTNFQEPQLQYALQAKDSNGDPEEAFKLLSLLEESSDGIVRSYDPHVKLLGAVNREGVTCYLDALLFAMFARLGSFEAMLYNKFEDAPRKKLSVVLRLWVNMLRTGKLISPDIVRAFPASHDSQSETS